MQPCVDDGPHRTSSRPTPPGCGLAGRRVVVVGGGHVAQRRVATSWRPARTSRRGLPGGDARDRGAGRRAHPGAARVRRRRPRRCVVRRRRHRRPRGQRARRAAAAEQRRIFCVRADDARAASAWTPAVGPPRQRHGRRARQPGAAQVGGAARRDPRGAARGPAHAPPTPTTAPPAWCSSAAAPATRSWSRSPAARR